jgi:hypothetical protein
LGKSKQGIQTGNKPREDSNIKTLEKKKNHSSENKLKRDKGSR